MRKWFYLPEVVPLSECDVHVHGWNHFGDLWWHVNTADPGGDIFWLQCPFVNDILNFYRLGHFLKHNLDAIMKNWANLLQLL